MFGVFVPPHVVHEKIKIGASFGSQLEQKCNSPPSHAFLRGEWMDFGEAWGSSGEKIALQMLCSLVSSSRGS